MSKLSYGFCSVSFKTWDVVYWYKKTKPLLSLSLPTAQEMGHDNRAGETEEAGTNNSSGKYPDDDSPASSPLPAGMQQQPEKKQQERRKKAAMFLSRLKRGGAGGGSKEEEGAAQPVYGKQGLRSACVAFMQLNISHLQSKVTLPQYTELLLFVLLLSTLLCMQIS